MEKEMKYEKKLEELARKHKYGFFDRGNNKIELVRMVGDWLDSRATITLEDGEIVAECVVWFYNDGSVFSKTVFDNVKDYKFLEELDKTLNEMNKKFKKICIDEDVDFNEW